MNNLSLNELKQLTKIRHIENYKDISKEDLLIAFLKSNQSHTEIKKINGNTEIRKAKKIFNELRNNLFKKEMKRVRKKFMLKKVLINI